jgi:phage protein U
MQLGAFQFETGTAAYSELRRVTEEQWAELAVVGERADLQHVGSSDRITLAGVVYPGLGAGLGRLDELRDLAATRQAHMLVSGEGAVLGRWVIVRVEESASSFLAGGSPQRQEFTVQLTRARDDA